MYLGLPQQGGCLRNLTFGQTVGVRELIDHARDCVQSLNAGKR